jgi:hypothetical protein
MPTRDSHTCKRCTSMSDAYVGDTQISAAIRCERPVRDTPVRDTPGETPVRDTCKRHTCERHVYVRCMHVGDTRL